MCTRQTYFYCLRRFYYVLCQAVYYGTLKPDVEYDTYKYRTIIGGILYLLVLLFTIIILCRPALQ